MKLSTTEKHLLWFLYDWIRPIRPGDMKEHLELKHSTLNSQLEVLKKKGLVSWKKYGPASLTQLGRMVASHHVRHTRLLEFFLINTLSIDEEVAHEESITLAPLVSCRLADAINSFLNNPERSPCCGEIPQLEERCVFEKQEEGI